MVATDFWRLSFSAAVTEYEVVTAPQSQHCMQHSAEQAGVLVLFCSTTAGLLQVPVVCEHRGNRDLSHLHTHLDPRLYSECVES